MADTATEEVRGERIAPLFDTGAMYNAYFNHGVKVYGRGATRSSDEVLEAAHRIFGAATVLVQMTPRIDTENAEVRAFLETQPGIAATYAYIDRLGKDFAEVLETLDGETRRREAKRYGGDEEED